MSEHRSKNYVGTLYDLGSCRSQAVLHRLSSAVRRFNERARGFGLERRDKKRGLYVLHVRYRLGKDNPYACYYPKNRRYGVCPKPWHAQRADVYLHRNYIYPFFHEYSLMQSISSAMPDALKDSESLQKINAKRYEVIAKIVKSLNDDVKAIQKVLLHDENFLTIKNELYDIVHTPFL